MPVNSFAEKDFEAPRPERPPGVVVLSFLDAFLVGAFPALMGVLQINASLDQSPQEITLTTLCLTVGLPVTVITAAFGAFYGSDRSRVALIFLVTLAQALQIFRLLLATGSGLLSGQETAQAMAQILWAAFVILVNIWYFLKPSTISYYRRKLTAN